MYGAIPRPSFREEIGNLLVSFSHGGLIAAGLVALAFLAAGYLEAGRAGHQVSLPSVVSEAHAESEAPTAREPEPPARVEAPATVKLSREMARVKAFVARRYRVSQIALEPPLAEAESAASDLGLDPLLIVAVIAIESSFNPFAESTVGAQGLMQVIPRFHMDKIGEGAGKDALFDPQLNVRVGALVIKEGLRRFGTLERALQYYGGALKDPKARYANKVLAMKARLSKAAKRSKSA